jgi:general secretion pathway protein E
VRTLCKDRKEEHIPDLKEREILGIPDGEVRVIYKPVGCEKCNHNGYRGRVGIHELLVVDEQVRELIHNGHGEQAIEKYVRSHTPSIREVGFAKIFEGKTTLEEVLRVTREDG